jgi:1,4-dihydroxy-6-naphthoate synthase
LLILVPTAAEAELLGDDLPGPVRVCGFGLAAAGAGAAHAIATHPAEAEAGVVLVGAAGTYDPDRFAIGTAIDASSVRIDGIGAGGAGPAQLGFAEADVIALTGADGELLSVAEAAGTAAAAAERAERHPSALAEEMEGFAVAVAAGLQPGGRPKPCGVADGRGPRRSPGAHPGAGVKLRLGLSTCPNDTFAFHAILERRIDLRDLEFEAELLDVQALNDGLFADRYDISKASFHAALLLADRYGVVPAGSALGFGVGPLIVAARDGVWPSPDARVLCPGPTTTATLLYRCLHPDSMHIDHAVFSDIGPALKRGDHDLGVLIHEGRLTYRRDGLQLVEDLGASFEELARAPVPLGGVVARLDLPDGVVERFTAVLRDSIAYAAAHRGDALVTIRRHAQELGEDVIWPYVALYVTEHTVDLGAEGARALEVLEQTGREAAALPEGLPRLRILA